MVDEIPVMIASIFIAVGVMLISSGYIIRILDQHPSLKILALSFLQLRDPYRERGRADGSAGPSRASDDDAAAGAASA
jgi:hypothetical protein